MEILNTLKSTVTAIFLFTYMFFIVFVIFIIFGITIQGCEDGDKCECWIEDLDPLPIIPGPTYSDRVCASNGGMYNFSNYNSDVISWLVLHWFFASLFLTLFIMIIWAFIDGIRLDKKVKRHQEEERKKKNELFPERERIIDCTILDPADRG